MKNPEANHNDLYELFVEQLQDMLSAETQLVQMLPNLAQKASNDELRKAITTHLGETKNQVERLEKICTLLNAGGEKKTCQAMIGLVKEAEEMTSSRAASPVLDAAIIAAAQKVEHYEIATYGTLRSWANQLDVNDEIVDLLKESLDEEAAADKKLTKIAEGSLFSFSSGVNKLAACSTQCCGSKSCDQSKKY